MQEVNDPVPDPAVLKVGGIVTNAKIQNSIQSALTGYDAVIGDPLNIVNGKFFWEAPLSEGTLCNESQKILKKKHKIEAHNKIKAELPRGLPFFMEAGIFRTPPNFSKIFIV